MSYCGKCENLLPTDGAFVACHGCKCDMHYECAKLKGSTYSGMSNKRKIDWRCEFCRMANKIAEIILPKIDTSLFTSLITPIKEEFSELRLQVGECVESQRSILGKYEELIANYKKIDSTVGNLRAEIDEIKKISETEGLSSLQTRINKIEQDQLKNAVILYNVEERINENLPEIVKNIGSRIDLEIQQKDLQEITRIPHSKNKQNNSENKPRPIKIIFRENDLKMKILNVKKNSTINNSDLIENGLDCSIKMYEMLTPFNKNLLYQTRQRAVAKQWKYVWFRYGHVNCRKVDGSKVIPIFEEKDLNKII